MTQSQTRKLESEPVSLPVGPQTVLPINRCNLPAAIIATLSFQKHPQALEIDGILPHHQDLFARLARCPDDKRRRECFADYVAVHFRLPGYPLSAWPEADDTPRPQANYRRLLLGWLFDSDSDSGAAWRLWVESRFGLVTRYHKELIPEPESGAYFRYMQACVRATYNTNDLASQLDLLYSFCQYELKHLHPGATHITLYRGGRELPEYQVEGEAVMLFNNLSSFTQEADEAYRFGPKVFAVEVPLCKIVCYHGLLPGPLDGEQEYMVLGGFYRVKRFW